MTIKKTTISDIDAFIKDAEKARKNPISQEDIDLINEISRQIDGEESVDVNDIPFVAKSDGDFIDQPQL